MIDTVGEAEGDVLHGERVAVFDGEVLLQQAPEPDARIDVETLQLTAAGSQVEAHRAVLAGGALRSLLGGEIGERDDLGVRHRLAIRFRNDGHGDLRARGGLRLLRFGRLRRRRLRLVSSRWSWRHRRCEVDHRHDADARLLGAQRQHRRGRGLDQLGAVLVDRIDDLDALGGGGGPFGAGASRLRRASHPACGPR
jgi:hypothetical protein